MIWLPYQQIAISNNKNLLFRAESKQKLIEIGVGMDVGQNALIAQSLL